MKNIKKKIWLFGLSVAPLGLCFCSNSCKYEYVLPKNALPFSVYSHNGMILTGFKDDVDWAKYSSPKYDTMVLPEFLDGIKIFSVTKNAFFDGTRTTIPENIKNLKLQYSWNYTYFGNCCFKNAPFVSMDLPNLCDRYTTECFAEMSNLTSIYVDWRWPYVKLMHKEDQGTDIFANVNPNGIFKYHKDQSYEDEEMDPNQKINFVVFSIFSLPSDTWKIEFVE